MIRYLLALLALAFATPAVAGPTLDPTTHPYIALVTTSKAVFRTGETGNVVVTLRNAGGSTFTGNAIATIYLNTAIVGQTTTPVTITSGGAPVYSVPFTITNTGDRGYHVDVTLRDGANAIVDAAPASIDVQASTFAAAFPRQCWVGKWDTSINAASLLDSQVAWHCNSVQGYANYYRPELAPPASLATWPSLSNLTVSRATINSVITAAHARSMPVGFFQATGEAYNTWPAQAVKPKLAWGSFNSACGKTVAGCTEADMNRSPDAPDNWSQYNPPWQADHLDFFDPCNAGWQQHLISKSIRPMLDQFAFDFWQADTVGAPSTNGGITYDYKGNPIDTKACLGDFTTGAAARIGKPTILNNVCFWGLVDTAFAGAQPYVYAETWNFCPNTQYYPGLNAVVSGSAYGLRRYTTRPIVQPAYMQRNLADRCTTGQQTTGCTLNGNSPLLATAMFAIAGSTLMNHADDGCVQTNVFVEGQHLPCTAAVVNNLLSYKAFEVSYQHMLRDAVTDSTEACLITSGATGSGTGAAGQVYVLGKNKAGFQICHLLNLTGVSSNDWTDLEGTKEKPTTLTNVGMKMYYYGNTVVPGTNKLWWASPDVANGAAQALSYTAGSDGAGRFVTFTLPSLSYWDMIALETSIADTNLSIDGRQPVRGNWYSTASAGISSAGTYASAACCKRYAGYKRIQVGAASSTVNIIYSALKTASVTFHLDAPDGATIGSCPLPVGTIATAQCTVSAVSGLHDIYVEFNQPVSLFSFYFS
jgi:dextranase